MKESGFHFDERTRALISDAVRGGRLPHAVIIESADAEKALEAAVFLSMYAVCASDDRPCGVCKNCVNAKQKTHPDVTYVPLLKDKKQYAVDQIRELFRDASIVPNEAEAKVYVFEHADERLAAQIPAQNAFLKLSEEPPPNVMFLLLCQNAQRLLPTILSRFTVMRLGGGEALSGDALSAARAIAEGILESREYPLLKAVNALSEKDKAGEILAAVRQSLRDALVMLSGGTPLGDQALARQLAGRLTKNKLMEMIALCGTAETRIRQNGNISLLTTWLCGELRRITWQR